MDRRPLNAPHRDTWRQALPSYTHPADVPVGLPFLPDKMADLRPHLLTPLLAERSDACVHNRAYLVTVGTILRAP